MVNKQIEVTGQKHGRLLAVRPTDQRKDRKVVWEYLCDCGKTHFTTSKDVLRGKTTSCGCFRKERSIEANRTHGATQGIGKRPRSYSIWRAMLNRCKPDYEKAHRYHQRGISVCERWLKYENFLMDMGEPDTRASLDRIDNNRGYQPGNCRWADDTLQAINRGNRTEMCILVDVDYLF